ncbi:MAG: hypothetical protein P8I94_04200, partial [Emcibacteraceae bacterium]|nr:hypothetical protein [Emcibacteraceae bacterium]
MRHKIIFAIAAAFVLYFAFFNRDADGVDQITADMVINNTTIYTANDAQWTAQAVAVKDDKIIFVGSNADVETYIGEGTAVHDMAGN